MQRLRDTGRLAAAAVTAVVTLVALTACGGTPSGDSGADGGSGADSGSWPVRIASALGTATIPAQPKRVVTLGWGSDDATLALGVTPVGMAINVPEAAGGITPWAKAKLGDTRPVMFTASTDTIPYEKIAELRPDVILAVYSGVTDKQYATLSKIAPTVAYPGKPWSTSWTDQLDTVGRALGRSEQAARLRTQVQQSIARAAAQHPEFRGKTAIFGSGTQPGNYNLYVDSDARMQLLGQLGFTVSDAATKTFPHSDDTSTFSTSVSLEQLPRLKTDVLVAWYLSKSTQASIEKQPLFASLPAVRDKAYVPITDPALLFATSAPNVLTIPWMLQAYVPLLSTAARNAG